MWFRHVRPLLEKLALPAHTWCNIPPISAPRTRPSPVSDAGIKPEASCSEAGKLLKPPAHLRVCAITASRENNAVTRSDKLAGTQDDPGHPPVIDREPPHVLVSEDCQAAVENRPEELANQAQTLASHVLPIALLNESRIPVGSAVDATPGDLLLRRHKAWDVVRHRDALTPIAEFEARDEISLDGPAKRVRARGPIVIMVGHTTDDTKT